MAFDHIAVIGAGAWGTALALTCARAGRKVTLWEPDAATAAGSQPNAKVLSSRGAPRRRHRHSRRNLAETARAAAILLVVPAQAVRAVAKSLAR